VLGYAITIAKAQGLSLEKAFIDIQNKENPGLTYVALSRVKNFENILLADFS